MAPAAHRPFPAGASALETLAHAYGVDTEFEGRAVSPDTLRAVLAAMGVDAGSADAAE